MFINCIRIAIKISIGFFLAALVLHAPLFPASASPGLIAHFTFDGDTLDYSGNEYHGTNNGATFSAGINGQALYCDGIDDYVLVPLNINPDPIPQLTITAWVQAGNESGVIVSHDNGGYDRQLSIDNRGGGLGWSAFSGTGGVLGFQPVEVDEWVFLAVVYDQDAGTVQLYVNDTIYNESGILSAGTHELNIGRSASYGTYFRGAIDDLRLYDSALTATEISSLYHGVAPSTSSTISLSPGMVAHYPFDNDLNDHSDNDNHGIQKGTITFASGAVNNGAIFDGQSYIEVPDSSSLDLKDGFTFSAWLHHDDAGTGGWSVILSKGDTSSLSNDSPYALAHTQDGRYPLVRLTQNNNYSSYSSNTAAPFGELYLLTVTWDGQDIDFYINGSYTDNSTASLLIGCDPPGVTEYFKGIIDELRIYNYPLTSSDIEALYNQRETAEPEHEPEPQPPSATETKASLKFESSSGRTGDTVKIPIVLADVQEPIGNIDIVLKYDASVLNATGITKGPLLSSASFDSNILGETILLAFFDSQGISSGGSVAIIEFQVTGGEGDTAALIVESILANKSSDSSVVNIMGDNGLFNVLSALKGDCDGDGEITVNDALHILSAAVGKIATEPIMDVNNDSKVSSIDARMVLRAALGLEANN
jgi:hypothetical protein